MSVPEGKRNIGKLKLETEAVKFLDYLLLTTSKYYLPPTEDDKKDMGAYENAKWYAEQIRNEMFDSVTYIQTANKIRIVDDATLRQRIMYQNKAERKIESVLTAVTLMYNKKLIKSKRVKYIGLQICNLKKMLQAWRKSDKEKYNKQQSTNEINN